jgi:hypothetical protein
MTCISLDPGKVQNGSACHPFGFNSGSGRTRPKASLSAAPLGRLDRELGAEIWLTFLRGKLYRCKRVSLGSSAFASVDRSLVDGPIRSSRFEVLFRPASRSRRRTSRITWDRIAFLALASLIRFDARSSSWSINVNDGRSDETEALDLGSRLDPQRKYLG